MAKKLVKGLIDLTVATPLAGASIEIVEESPIPAPLRRGTSSLIGVGVLKGGIRLL